MADYWKSQAKKFCEFCKCWIADNRPSIDFHEKGKRHKENVALRLKNISKQSLKDHKEKRKIDEDLKKMEMAALKAYVKDVEANADYTSQILNKQLSEERARQESSSTSDHDETNPEGREPVKPETKEDKLWYEAVSDEGYTYYWNTQTGESIWEPPEGGFVSIDEQKKLEEEELQKAAKKKMEEARRKEEEEKMKAEEQRAYLERMKMRRRAKAPEPEVKAVAPIGPAPRGNPYGSWTTVKENKQKPVDLQLPQQRHIEIKVPVLSSAETEIKFKEKNVSVLSVNASDGDSDVGFKKRKLNTNAKRNMRQRFSDN